jgi:hypothetical protein
MMWLAQLMPWVVTPGSFLIIGIRGPIADRGSVG